MQTVLAEKLETGSLTIFIVIIVTIFHHRDYHRDFPSTGMESNDRG